MKTYNKIIPVFCVIAILVTLGFRSVIASDPQNDGAPYQLTNEQLDKTFNVKPETKMPDDYVRVLYFHRIPGCATCQTMSKYVCDTIMKTYSEEVKNRQIVLRYFNFEDPQNAKLVKTFKIASPSLVLIQGRNGKDVKAIKADKIWSLAGDKTAFMKYVGKEINSFLKPDKQPNKSK